ncbi:unknown [Crocosphaera subtropica ATCC 51142]|uniref:Universal stress protein n=1 Tax=Crocosphaera subtropica (strain ATCC 51142 / BH68) TaxID=43989 RepID=B1WTB8_CROS5|nr:universal stress protein [Crocosphaera subtropica]ACB52040.1 unknown [Crocosphaera subtropica ATCC 51142]
MKYQKILIALDNSPLAKKVFEEGLSIAKYHEAALKLFHCLPIETPSTVPYTSLYEGEFNDFSYLMREQLETQAKEAEKWLKNYAAIADKQGVSIEWDWKIGEPGRWVKETAQDWQADLIVVGRRGLTGVSEMLLGSVSNYIVHHSPCSVLVVQETKVN